MKYPIGQRPIKKGYSTQLLDGYGKIYISVGTAAYCSHVIANVDVAGSLSVYGDASHTTEKHVWNHLQHAQAYFKGTFTSPSVSLFMVRLDTVTATVHFVRCLKVKEDVKFCCDRSKKKE